MRERNSESHGAKAKLYGVNGFGLPGTAEKLSRKGRRFRIRFLGTQNWQYCVEVREKLRHTRLEAAGIQPFAGGGQGVVVELVSRLDGRSFSNWWAVTSACMKVALLRYWF